MRVLYTLGARRASHTRTWSLSFARTLPLKMGTTSVLGRSWRPLLGGLCRPPIPGGREGEPLGEVSNRSQQTALLPRPGSWEPQAQPRSGEARAFLGGRGKWGGVLGRVPSPAPGALYAAQWFLEALKCERAATFSSPGEIGKDWSWIQLCPSAFLAGCMIRV